MALSSLSGTSLFNVFLSSPAIDRVVVDWRVFVPLACTDGVSSREIQKKMTLFIEAVMNSTFLMATFFVLICPVPLLRKRCVNNPKLKRGNRGVEYKTLSCRPRYRLPFTKALHQINFLCYLHHQKYAFRHLPSPGNVWVKICQVGVVQIPRFIHPTPVVCYHILPGAGTALTVGNFLSYIKQ